MGWVTPKQPGQPGFRFSKFTVPLTSDTPTADDIHIFAVCISRFVNCIYTPTKKLAYSQRPSILTCSSSDFLVFDFASDFNIPQFQCVFSNGHGKARREVRGTIGLVGAAQQDTETHHGSEAFHLGATENWGWVTWGKVGGICFVINKATNVSDIYIYMYMYMYIHMCT